MLQYIILCTLLNINVAKLTATPFGMRHQECIIEVSNGATVDEDSNHLLVTNLQGTVTKHIPNALCSTTATATPNTFSSSQNNDPSCNLPPCTCAKLPCNNWMDNAGSMNTKQIIGGMSSTYLTPNTPSKSSGQTLFYFIGAENTNGIPRQGNNQTKYGRAILQPVLTYDPAGWCVNSTTGWCFSSWYCCPKDLTVHSNYIQNVEPGDLFFGQFNLYFLDWRKNWSAQNVFYFEQNIFHFKFGVCHAFPLDLA